MIQGVDADDTLRGCPEPVAISAPRGSYPGGELDSLAAATNYYRWIVGEFAPYLGSHVVEVGAGTGTFASHLLAAADIAALTLVEPADNLISRLRQRFAGDTRVRVHHGYLEELSVSGGCVQSVVMVNVLEHIQDDRATLTTAYRLLEPGGHCLLFVPALPTLFGSLDLSFRHRRRYTRDTLARLLYVSGFGLRKLRFMNAPGVIAWYVAGKILKRHTLTSRSIGLFDRFVVPIAAGLERRWKLPIGQSLLAVARKERS